MNNITKDENYKVLPKTKEITISEYSINDDKQILIEDNQTSNFFIHKILLFIKNSSIKIYSKLCYTNELLRLLNITVLWVSLIMAAFFIFAVYKRNHKFTTGLYFNI